MLSLPFPSVVTQAQGTGFPGPRDSSRAASAPPFLGWPEGRSVGRAGLPTVRGHATRWVSGERLLPTRHDSLMALPGDGLASGRKPSGRAGSLFYQRVPAARQRPFSLGLVFQPSVRGIPGISSQHCGNCCCEFLGRYEAFGNKRSRDLSPGCLKLAETPTKQKQLKL